MTPRQRETVRDRGPRERPRPAVRVALRIATATLVVLAGLLTVAFIDGNWRFAHLAVGDLRLFVDGNYYGKQYFDAFNTERDAQGAYGVANARLSLESTGKRGYAIGAWIKNLTNRQYLAYALNQGDADTGALGFDYALVGEPRTYGIDATLRF